MIARDDFQAKISDSLAEFNKVACWTVLTVPQFRQYLAAHLAGDLLPEEEKTTPAGAAVTPDFFQVGHVYAREHHGRRIEFHVLHIATAPDCAYPTAFGWRKDPEIDVVLPSDADDLTGWTDVTEGGDSDA